MQKKPAKHRKAPTRKYNRQNSENYNFVKRGTSNVKKHAESYVCTKLDVSHHLPAYTKFQIDIWKHSEKFRKTRTSGRRMDGHDKFDVQLSVPLYI